MPVTRDTWDQQKLQLQADGYIFTNEQRYDPTILTGYTPFTLTGSPAQARKANRPFFVWLRRTTASASDPWNGTLSLGATSQLRPWVNDVIGGTMAVGALGLWLAGEPDWPNNPIVMQEMDAARLTPVATLTKQYGDCSDGATAQAAIRDLAASIVVP